MDAEFALSIGRLVLAVCLIYLIHLMWKEAKAAKTFTHRPNEKFAQCVAPVRSTTETAG